MPSPEHAPDAAPDAPGTPAIPARTPAPDDAAPHGVGPEDEARARRVRRLLFRAAHRGTKENDLLLGGFVAARAAELDEADLDVLETILDLPDPDLAEWLSGRHPIPDDLEPAPVAAMLARIRDAAIAGAAGPR